MIRRILWTVLLFWISTSLAVIQGVQMQFISAAYGPRLPFSFAVRLPLSHYWFWAAVTPVVLWLVKRFPLQQHHLVRNTGVHAAMSVVLSLAYAFYRMPMHNYVYPFRMRPMPSSLLSFYFLGNLIDNLLMYGLLLGIGHAWYFFRRYQSRELALAEARLQALKMQLQPHFLFNTLNTISALMAEDLQAAEDMMSNLGNLLRRTLESSQGHEVTVRRELEFLEPYVAIQKARFESGLDFAVRVDSETMEALLPTLVVQTLVENAVRHGVGSRLTAGRIDVIICRRESVLHIEVNDNGRGLTIPFEEAVERGIGLKNTSQRLHELYGSEHRLVLKNAEIEGCTAVVELPFRLAGVVCTKMEDGVER